MNLFESWKGIIEKAQSMKEKDLAAWKFLLMVVIVADLFGVYYYLELKKLGMAVLIVAVIFLAIILFLEGKLPKEAQEISKDEPKKKKEEDYVEIKLTEGKERVGMGDMGIGIGLGDLGLPSSDEYNKRLKDAYGEI